MKIIQKEKSPATIEREARENLEISAAEKLLEKLKKQAGETFEPFTYNGEKYFIKCLNYGELVELALQVARDGHDVLNIQNGGGLNAVTRAVLLGTVYRTESERFFSYESVTAFMDEPAAASLVSALFERSIARNPGIFSIPKK